MIKSLRVLSDPTPIQEPYSNISQNSQLIIDYNKHNTYTTISSTVLETSPALTDLAPSALARHLEETMQAHGCKAPTKPVSNSHKMRIAAHSFVTFGIVKRYIVIQ